MIPKSCPGHKTGRIPALLPVNIFWFSIIGAKLKAEKHALWAALRSAACGGALRRCAAPSAAARRYFLPLRGATRPARCARSLSGNMKKMPHFFWTTGRHRLNSGPTHISCTTAIVHTHTPSMPSIRIAPSSLFSPPRVGASLWQHHSVLQLLLGQRRRR